MGLALDAPPVPGSAQADNAWRSSRALSRRRWLLDEVAEHVEFGLARDIRALDDAARLVHDQYVWRGYMAPRRSGRRRSPHDALATTRVFVASAGSRVIGTVTLIQDSPIGLPMDEIYREELAGLRARGRRVAEVSALAMDPRHRTSGVGILLRLMRMLVIYAADIVDLDDLCIAVNPRHVAFYRRCLNFRRFGPRTSFARVNGAPAEALRLDLRFVRDLIAVVQSAARSQSSLYDFFFGAESYETVIDQLDRHPSAASPAGHLLPDDGILMDAVHDEASVA